MTTDATAQIGGRALERLGSELIAWLTTVTPDGQPQSMPVWFLWTAAGEILVYSHRTAVRNRNLRANPKVALHLREDEHGDDVVSIDGEARIDPDHAQGEHNPAFLAKYQGRLDASKWTAAYFSEQYNVPVLIRPRKIRTW